VVTCHVCNARSVHLDQKITLVDQAALERSAILGHSMYSIRQRCAPIIIICPHLWSAKNDSDSCLRRSVRRVSIQRNRSLSPVRILVRIEKGTLLRVALPSHSSRLPVETGAQQCSVRVYNAGSTSKRVA
jgi:hypothetical protein